jgi:hypothetical protein
MKTSRFGIPCLLAAVLIWDCAATSNADQYSLAKPKNSNPPSSQSKGVPATLSDPVTDFTKKENLEVKGKFQVFRAADNSILIAVGQKYETIFLSKTTKMTRGEKTIQPADLKEGDALQAKVVKTQGKMTATEIVVPVK